MKHSTGPESSTRGHSVQVHAHARPRTHSTSPHAHGLAPPTRRLPASIQILFSVVQFIFILPQRVSSALGRIILLELMEINAVFSDTDRTCRTREGQRDRLGGFQHSITLRSSSHVGARGRRTPIIKMAVSPAN